MSIHLYDDDPRQYTDKENYLLNHGSFAAVAINLNKSLKKLGYYSDIDNAEWVGKCEGLDTSFHYRDKKNFLIHVWETTSLPIFVYQNGVALQKRIFGLSNQITKLWHLYGRNDVTTVYGGCDTDFWQPTIDKNSDKFQFCHVNSSNVRSGLDLTIQAFSLAFSKNKDVVLKIKDTNIQNDNAILPKQIDKYNKKFDVNIEYYSNREPATYIRDLYSESHVTLNMLRATSFGMPLLDCSACNSLCVTGDFEPTNELIKNDMGILLKPNGLVILNNVIPNLVHEWGLYNCYGAFPHFDEPCIYNFDINEYANLLQTIYNQWEKYRKIDTRTPIIKNWSWDKSALTLKNQLYGI